MLKTLILLPTEHFCKAMEILPSVGCRVPYRMMNCFSYKKTSTESVCLVEKVEVKYLL